MGAIISSKRNVHLCKFSRLYDVHLWELSSSSSSILQAIPLFEAYWLGISIFRHDPTCASLLTRHSAAPHYNASIALVAPTGGDIGTIHVQVQLVVVELNIPALVQLLSPAAYFKVCMALSINS